MAIDDISTSPNDIRLETSNINTETHCKLKSAINSFTEVSLSGKRKKAPKRILHFSDGILEEYSTDEECDTVDDKKPLIEPKTLSWIPYIWYLAWYMGSKALSVCDYLGEHLAYFFGITAPKYYYEIEEYKRWIEEEEEEKNKTLEEIAGWQTKSPNLDEVQIEEPERSAYNPKFTTKDVDSPPESQNWERY